MDIKAQGVLYGLGFHSELVPKAVGQSLTCSLLRPCMPTSLNEYTSALTHSGMAIGIGVRTVFSHSGTAELISVGVLNSFSAGILVSYLPLRHRPAHV